MKRIIYTPIPHGETQYVAERLGLPVLTQREILDELTRNLREAMALQMEDEDLPW